MPHSDLSTPEKLQKPGKKSSVGTQIQEVIRNNLWRKQLTSLEEWEKKKNLHDLLLEKTPVFSRWRVYVSIQLAI
jgi:hypothetical protein